MNSKATKSAHTRAHLGHRVAMLVAAVLVATASPALVACSGAGQASNASSQPAAAEKQAQLTVTQKVGDVEKTVEVAEGSTVLDVLTASGVPFESSNGSYGAYVTSIDGKAAGSNTGWTFSVNGEQPTVGCDACKVADGDIVAWEFVSFE
ncbi:DUF4430 domain-containing protein [Atopobiaceae bacterium 24-176]